jgi:putative transposase
VKEHNKKSTRIVLTFRFRIKGGSSERRLSKLASQVNLIWNFCNETSFHAIRNHSKWLSHINLDALLTGTSKLTGLHSQTIQAVSKEFVNRRVHSKKRKLRWRVSKGSARSLGWIPFKQSGIKIEGNRVRYAGQEFKFWNSWESKGGNQRNWKEECIKVLNGAFSEDAKGNWYLNVACEVKPLDWSHEVQEIGGDPGLKNTLVLSDGRRIENKRYFHIYEQKLAKAQRFRKKRLVKKYSRKVANSRKNDLQQETTRLVRKYRTIYIGNLSGKFLQQTNGKSSADASVGTLHQLLKYKAMKHSGRCFEVFEGSTTITCSACLEKTGPSGLSGLAVREWLCSQCGCHHDRDVNAARNILRFGRESLKQPIEVA